MPASPRDIANNLPDRSAAMENFFVSEYIKDGNGIRSAIDSGWCDGSNQQAAADLACRLLKLPRVVRLLSEHLNARIARNLITADRIWQELYRLGTYNLQDAYDAQGNLIPVNQLPEDLARALEGFETEQQVRQGVGPVRITKYKFARKSVALATILERLEGLIKRVEVSGPGGVPLGSSSSVDVEKLGPENVQKLIDLYEARDKVLKSPAPPPPINDGSPVKEGTKE